MTSVTLNEAREAIYQEFASNTSLASANYTFGNEKYTPPTTGRWARLTVAHENGEQETLGEVGLRKFLRRGRVLVQLYDSVDNGLYDLDQLADATRDIFEGTTLSGVYFNNVDIRESGSDGEWYQVVVDAPFFYTETK